MLRKIFFSSIITTLLLLNEFIVADDLFLDNPLYNYNDEPSNVKIKKYKTTFKTESKYTKNYKKEIKFLGGCLPLQYEPINGNWSCSSDSGCRAACRDNYRFPHGEREIVIVCRGKQWKVQGADYETIPHCEPICLPECKNKGICIAPNQCDCSENFSGPQCQFENKPCLNLPPLTINARQSCNTKTCTVKCREDYVFPDGSSVANLICKHGHWESTRSDWATVPDCIPVCHPPCQNDGICLTLNDCQCPQDFVGPQCQYSAKVCDTSKLGFNGNIRCHVNDKYSQSCTLECPNDGKFEFPPAEKYICHYERGTYEPQPIPQCLPRDGATLVKSVKNSSFYKTFNSSWSIKDIKKYESFKSGSYHINYSGSYGVSGTSDNLQNYDIAKNSMTKSERDKQIFGDVVGEGTLQNFNSGGSVQMENVVVRKESGSCFSWAGSHYKSFNGHIYSFDSTCAYTLVKDMSNGFYTISIQNDPHCISNSNTQCSRIIRIFLEGKEYTLSKNTVTHIPECRNSKNKTLPIPTQRSDLRIEAGIGGQYLIITLARTGLVIKWDGESMVQLEASEALWNTTAGLCGNLNGVRENIGNIRHMVNGWKIENIGEKCEERSKSHRHPCSANSELEHEANEFCTKLLADARYESCAKFVDLEGFESSCKWDYCSSKNKTDRQKSTCNTMEVYVRQCAHKGVVAISGWRNSSICPMECSNGKIYMSCGPKIYPTCDADISMNSNDATIDIKDCEEGCFCPVGTVLHKGHCIQLSQCPCKHRGKSFKPGESVPKDCNNCECINGKWRCTERDCGGRCSAVGDPHYTTFDGKHYDFMGQCTYYLVKGDNYSIEAENAVCTSAISEMMGFTRTFLEGEPSCTKTVTIRINDIAIKLKQNHQILVNSEDVTKLPMLAGGAKVRIVSSIFIKVELPNGLEILWDGVSRVYINAPAHFRGKTKGLCGTFTSSEKDDFLTPDGDVEQSVVAFANKWKTSEYCADIKKDSDHPCDVNPQKRMAAEKYCSVLKKKLFIDCHESVDPEPFYRDCVYDMCACDASIETCLCPTLAAYAKDCSQQGIFVPWRQEVKECRIHCPGDQEYQQCGSSCSRSCADISFNNECKEECVEGCNCPKDYALDINGECIPIGQCPCIYGEIEFLAGYRGIRPGTKGQEFCTCAGGKWDCKPAKPEEIKDYPPITQLKSLCSASKHQQVTTCEPVEPRTCRNMHQHINQSPAICQPGCICKPGYVLDVSSGDCVKEQECPCYHGGKSYKDESVMQEECNTCKCNAGKWNCTDIVCPGVCSVWGDSHYKTFDDRQFDFQGVCDYVLAKGKLNDVDSFDVSIRNVACGTTGVTCSKSITLTVGSGQEQKRVTLTRGKSLTSESIEGFERLAVRRAGLFIFLDVPDLGLVVQWDEGTRAYIRLDVRWKGRTKGLCGDFNDNAEDDFKTPAGGVSEASAHLFADSWKMSEICAESKDMQLDTCAKHPERKLWAVQKCRIMKSDVFEPCHSEVAPEDYIERCVSDACGCDDGGDCECLCTAIAAYAHECNTRGVPIKWRTQKLCPMQCDETCSTYSPCVSTCPWETCENLATLSDSLHLCDQDTCVEGCLPKPCPPNHVYLNTSYAECIHQNDCKRPVCKIIDAVEYYEGDKIKGDNCHECHCTKGKEICIGTPCVETTTQIIKETIPPVQNPSIQCVNGWTKWINRDRPKTGGSRNDTEEIPNSIDLSAAEGYGYCQRGQMIDIKCRIADSEISHKEFLKSLKSRTRFNVECDMENGSSCKPVKGSKQPCPDFEISLLCQCNEDTSTTETPKSHDICLLNDPYKVDLSSNCHDYFQCAPGLNGNELVRKTCGEDMMFNEESQICDWPIYVAIVTPSCGKINKPKSPCKEGEEWSDCAIRCSRTCSYYKYELTNLGKCNSTIDCIPGCVPTLRTECLNDNYYWKDWTTCVDRSRCTCKSDFGEPIEPGLPVVISHCKSCQCLNDFYTCDESACHTTATEFTSTMAPYIKVSKQTMPTVQVIPSTLTPPRECDGENYIWLINKTMKAEYKEHLFASSYNSYSDSSMIKIQDFNTFDVWRPNIIDDDPWVEVRFFKAQPIYGVIVKGDEFTDTYVTSYKVMYSLDGEQYSFVTDQNKEPIEYRGPNDGATPMRQIFHPPIEAKIVRLIPTKWHNGVAMQVELLGCDEIILSTTMPPISKIISPPVCNDAMGYDSEIISDQQVTVSSSYLPNIVPNLRLSSSTVWRPQFDNPNQYVQFDFLEPRNLTGIVTKGGNGIWTTAYKVQYSNDGKYWIPVINEETGVDNEFYANVDDYNSVKNYFVRPIGARYLRIYPTKWSRHIGLKVEVLGCFLPYSATTILPPLISPTPPSGCNLCPGVIVENPIQCRECDGFYDGKFCLTTKQQCPCRVGKVTYPIGTSFETNDCQHCQCVVGGVPICQPKSCPPCINSNERPVLTELCGCTCRACPIGERLCPTSNTCIDEAFWCDGITHCPDDEINCPNDSANTNVEKIITFECPNTCPPGFELVKKNVNYLKYSVTIKQTIITTYTQEIELQMPDAAPNFDVRMGGAEPEQKCQEFECKRIITEEGECPKLICPEGFELKYDQTKSHRKTNTCDNACVPIPIKERICEVVGKTFKTFDHVQYKFDACKHILARDRDSNRWVVILEKVCENKKYSCLNMLVVKIDDYKIDLHPTMNVFINNILYNSNEVKRFGDNHPAMKLSRIGDALRLEARNYPFWAMIDSNGAIKIGVSEQLTQHVDGMCGFMDGLTSNDKMTPQGTVALSTQDFGESWKLKYTNAECKVQECPDELRDKTWSICNQVKEELFDICDGAVDRNEFISSCLESTCNCMSSGNLTSSNECRCQALTSFVSECMANNKSVDLSTWRSVYNCPAVCKAPFVHKDCFRNKCEISCENLREENPCPETKKFCTPGCFCPDGMVRNGDTCVPPSECRDCVCEGLGSSKYVTFDRANILFNGNCTYVLSRDVLERPDGKHSYEVFVSNSACIEGTCIEAITLIYQSHHAQIRKGNQPHQLISVVDGQEIIKYPYQNDWLKLTETSNRDINLLVPDIQLEIVSFRHNFAYMLRLPSHTFSGAMEGLCGNCNDNQQDDLKKSDGKLTNDVQEFGDSWLLKTPPVGLLLVNDQHCSSTQKKECADQLPPNNQCEDLIAKNGQFARCHGVVDPSPYYLACKESLCDNGNYCANFEAYARMCSLTGSVCVDWRRPELCPYHCPSHLEYQGCKPGCPETCENLNKEEACLANPVEGCFCSPNHIWHNETCIHKNACYVCDDEGHIEGDQWQKDKCTRCSCSNRKLECQTTACPATICEENANPVSVPGTENDCCPKYLCVPAATPTHCIESQQPDCGYAQVLKTFTDSNGCRKFICQCVPKEECSLIESEIAIQNQNVLQPGFAKEIDTSGCCPKTSIVCKPETCPLPPECSKYYQPVIKDFNSCCPAYDCVPPKDLCLYDMFSSNDLNFVPNTIAKKIGDTWQDGKCKECSCQLINGEPKVNCLIKQCIDINNHPDVQDYVLKEIERDAQCCPDIVKEACMHDGRVYKAGEKWHPNPDDACVTMKCLKDNNEVIKKSTNQTCDTTCKFGSEYRPAFNTSEECCGKCIDIACVVDGELKYIGQTWYSNDNCNKSTCVAASGSPYVKVETENCKPIDPKDELNYKIEKEKVYGECCPKFKKTACISNGKYYMPGESWKSLDNDCVFESCLDIDGQAVKYNETKTCNTNCPRGWEYQQPETEKCCGECKQIYCVDNDILYAPNENWQSNDDNCSTYSCVKKGDQFSISFTPPICPNVSDCPDKFTYYDGCCKKCNVTTSRNMTNPEMCVAEVLDYEKTIGILIEKKASNILCRNSKPIDGLTECHGRCNSSTHFNFVTWNQDINCTCCKPDSFRDLIVEFTCEDGKKYKKKLITPTTCTCQKCS